MSVSAEALYKMSDVELLAAYGEARRQFLEKKFIACAGQFAERVKDHSVKGNWRIKF
jgi:TorA maturation chaperone TorD